MPDTALQITLDSASTFETLVPFRDALVCLPEGKTAELELDLTEDAPPSVVFAFGQLLAAAGKENRVSRENLADLAEANVPFSAMLAQTGLGPVLTETV
ncbi:hypothetical protein TG4357_01730 [Thalassovita gelatinovora]|uniref:STAS domain-containing protein n=1 Tax=Thalassovita gelatinovora TaxID=53501 RepID=A0A0P1FAY6_THAGE|nr:hypothetical protein [Thalassovita gelatinovora]QIZ80655.1 hypothetical protein HFZ77_09260 [Thalassovita gelatinovora]CUH65217.1 hypothetical protein TG4357_01730 [Thalassovita gelatinovora]SEQ87622.1 hypothetical protein SAMN04488043_11018 [Thalassovita gelatinovora]